MWSVVFFLKILTALENSLPHAFPASLCPSCRPDVLKPETGEAVLPGTHSDFRRFGGLADGLWLTWWMMVSLACHHVTKIGLSRLVLFFKRFSLFGNVSGYGRWCSKGWGWGMLKFLWWNDRLREAYKFHWTKFVKVHSWVEQWKKNWLFRGFLGDEILPSYIGIII